MENAAGMANTAIEAGAGKLSGGLATLGSNLGDKLVDKGENIAKVGLEGLGERLGKRLGDRLVVGLALLGAFIAVGFIGSALITTYAGPSTKDDAASRPRSAEPSPTTSDPRSSDSRRVSPRGSS